MEQLDLLAGIKAKPKSTSRDETPEEYLERSTVNRGEYMGFLYGQNPHICSIRFHCYQEDEGVRWINRKDAERILKKNKYVCLGTYRNGDKFAKVYRA